MTSTVLYPFLVGSDIGCGIAVFPFKLKRAVPEKLAARFPNLDRALDPEHDVDDPAWSIVDSGLDEAGDRNIRQTSRTSC